MYPIYGVNDSNGQSLMAVLVLLFISFALPAIVMWFDEKMYVNKLEKEQKDHTAFGDYI